jgi:phage-related protein
MRKAIKIDSEKRIIEEVEIGDSFQDLYPAIGNNCSTFTVPMYFDNGDALFCDDEAHLRPDQIKGGFIMIGWSYPIVGNGIILGTNEEGESTDYASSIESLQTKVLFLNTELLKEYAEKFV